jgi:CRP-like cAMP-binding protein/ATP/ADP translocase
LDAAVTKASLAARALSFLGVESSERRTAGLMTAHSFFMGCSTVFFETAASASFLARFESRFIPWVYLAAAAVNIVTGSVYARMQKRASFSGLMKGTLWFLLAIVATVRVGFAVSNVAFVAFAGLVSYRIISSLTDLEYWAVASRIYDVRQAKRLFGLVGTGEVVARIAGSFCVPLFVKIAGVSNLMVLSAGALVLCLFCLGRVLHGVAGAHSPAPESTAAAPRATLQAGLREIVRSPYLAVVVTVAVLATFGKYFVDFAFLEQISTVSKGEVELASLLGLFSGLTQTLSLLTRVFVSRPLLARLGIRVGVVILPLAHALCTLLTILTGIFGPTAAVFWLVIANQGIYKSLKHPIDNASFKVLYQPLKPEQRLGVQIAVEIIFSPVVVGIAGGVMLLFSSGMHYDPVVFSGVLLVVFVAWVFAARAAGRGYARKLVEMLRRRIEGELAFTFDDATTLTILRSHLDSPDPSEVCVTLRLLEKAAPADLEATLLGQTSHPSPIVRTYAIERLLELRPESLRRIRSRISVDPDPSVRGAALRAASASLPENAVAELTPYLADRDLFVRRAAFTVLLGLPNALAKQTGRAALADLATSAEPEERALAARLAGAHQLRELVVALLDDRHFAVRRAAIVAAGALRDRSLRPLLMDYLVQPRFAQAAALAIAAEGDGALPSLAELFVPSAEALVLRRIVYVHRLIGTPAATRALAARLAFPEVTVRSRVLRALDRLRWTAAEGAERELVDGLLRAEAASTAWALAARRDLGADDADADLDVVRRALDEEIADGQRRILHLLSFVHDRVAVHRAAVHVAHASKDKRAYAHEVLELLLDGDERALVLPFIGDATTTERLRLLADDHDVAPRSADARLAEIVERPARSLRRWSRDAAVWVLERRAARTRTSMTTTTPRETEMLLIEKVILLKTVAMFEHTPEELVAEVASIVEIVDFPKGRRIFDKGDAGESMYIVVSGEVRVFDGDRTLRLLGERELFGELALLDPEPRSASVETTRDTRLFRLDGDLFTQLMAANVDIVRGVLHVLCERLRATSAAGGHP